MGRTAKFGTITLTTLYMAIAKSILTKEENTADVLIALARENDIVIDSERLSKAIVTIQVPDMARILYKHRNNAGET